MAKIAITPDHGARLVDPFSHPLWYVFARGLRPSRAGLFTLAVSAAVDTFQTIYHHYSWYVHSPDLMRCSYVLWIVWS